MDKVVDHLLVFQGEGVIKDFPGNYTQYRDWSAMKSKEELEARNAKGGKSPDSGTAHQERLPSRHKPTNVVQRENASLNSSPSTSNSWRPSSRKSTRPCAAQRSR
jgi:ATP-binding cassette subfamily F protein uup